MNSIVSLQQAPDLASDNDADDTPFSEKGVSDLPAENKTFLEVKNVNKFYPTRSGKNLHVLENISFTANKNNICVLLGPSGCGKSTLLRLIAGLDQTSSGEIFIDDALIKGPARDRGMVFQSYTCFPWLTVRQNVEYGLKINSEHRTIAEGVVDHFLERVKLTDFANAFPNQLSGGMRQRVAIARAMSVYPSMLLMDEPFGALDAVTRWQMQELLLEIAERENITVMMVTHDIDEALFLGDEIVFLSIKPGRVKEVLTPAFKKDGRLATKEALYDHPDYRAVEHHVMSLMRDEEKID
ncbi:MAG: ABC transporter ATP-binding protein [Pseudomonadota bacterium]